MKIGGSDFVYQPDKTDHEGKIMSLGEQLFAAAHALPSGQKKESDGGRVVYTATDTLSQDGGYDKGQMKLESARSLDVYQHGIATTKHDSPINALGTDGMGPCVAPIAYAPHSKIGAMAHVDPPAKLDGFMDSFLEGFPKGESIRFDFVGGTGETEKQKREGTNTSRKHLTTLLEQMYHHPQSGHFDIRSFDVMEKAHDKSITLDTTTGCLYPGLAGGVQSLENGFRMVDANESNRNDTKLHTLNGNTKYAMTDSSPELAGQLVTGEDKKLRRQFDGLDYEGWVQQEQVVLQEVFKASVTEQLADLGKERLEQVDEALDTLTAGLLHESPDCIKALELELRTDLRRTPTASTSQESINQARARSLATHLVTGVKNAGEGVSAEQALKNGLESWKTLQAQRLGSAILEQAEVPDSKGRLAQALGVLVKSTTQEPLLLSTLKKLEPGDPPKFKNDMAPSSEELNNLVRTAQCMDSITQQRRMSPEIQGRLLTALAPELHEQLTANPNLKPEHLAKAVMTQVFDEKLATKKAMTKGERLGDFLSKRDPHKPIESLQEINTERAKNLVGTATQNVKNRKGMSVGDSIGMSEVSHQQQEKIAMKFK